MQKQSDRVKLGYRQGIVSLLVNLVLFGLKYWAGIVSGSVALIADAWHTLSDSISSLIVIAGVKLSSKKADEQHPFGHGRWEQIASLFIAFLLALIAFEFLKESIGKFQSRERAEFGIIAIVVTALSVLAKEGLAQYAFRIGKKTGNASIRADGWHHRSDALSSVLIIIGILLKNTFWWIDSVLGLLISLMLFHAVYEIAKEAIESLIGKKPDEELINRVKEIILEVIGIETGSHHFHLHSYGTHRELTFHIRVDRKMMVEEAHQIANEIEKEILRKLDINATIHVEPE